MIIHAFKKYLSHNYFYLFTITASLFIITSCKTTQSFAKLSDIMNQTPSNKESVSAIKQALNQGVQEAIQSLGKQYGFSKTQYKIPLPKNLHNIAEQARKFGLNQYVDNFETSLNQAAEKAIPLAANTFKSSIQNMSVQDVVSILNGPDNAATDYFKKTSSNQIIEKFKPVITQSTRDVGVTKHYKKLSSKIETYGKLLGLKTPDILDIDTYIATQATQALFQEIEKKEKDIRENPEKTASQLLEKVFGFYKK